MKSYITREFRKLLRELPPEIRKQAYDAYRLFKVDPFHTSLHFKELIEKYHVYSVRVGWSYRALGVRDPKDQVVWYWIGHHKEYDIILRKRPPDRLIR